MGIIRTTVCLLLQFQEHTYSVLHLLPVAHGVIFVVNSVTFVKFDLSREFTQSTQMVIVDLNAGDDVLVQNTKLGAGITGDRYSTFSGFLLYPADDTTEIIG